MRISDLVAFAMLLEACCFSYVAYWMGSLYRSAHASWLQALAAGNPDWLVALLLATGAAVYWRAAQARPWLQILAVLGAIYGVYTYLDTRSFGRSWNIFHGDVVAVSALSSVGLVLIGVLAALDHYAAKSRRYSRPI